MRPPRRPGSERSAGQAETPFPADPGFETFVRSTGRLGLRADVFSADVDSVLEANSGSESDALLSPKLSLILGPWRSTEVYLNLGHGYHSNDARGAVLAVDPVSGEPARPVEPLVSAKCRK